ncbi:MAG: S-formylglutathione hydrolase FrmB [Microbacteriaceae bacterium]|nr:S-formylglutathione hydrolase FrmB [Microbacteriaceae bacterium]
MPSLITLNIVDGSVLLDLLAVSLLALVFLLVRHQPRSPLGERRRWAFVAATGGACGALLATLIIILFTQVLNVFGVPLEWDIRGWFIAALAAMGVAVVNLWHSRWWRKVIAVIGVLAFGLTASVAINASYGFNPTVASLLNINVGHKIVISKQEQQPVVAAEPNPLKPPPAPPKPLWQTWTPPADMPAVGQLGTVTVPGTVSGFGARPAYLYLPPAALVADPPTLPIVIAMMGQPGGPDSANLYLDSLNAIANAHKGLAPIVLTIDQIGSPLSDPLCIDSPRGHVYTYVITDVLSWVQHNLHVAQGPHNWTVAGYSNGGECALSFGAKHPEFFGSILDVSGEIGPSLGDTATTLRIGFGGDQAFFDREQPVNIMAATHYDDMVAVFTSGSTDTYFGAEQNQAQAAAAAAGMTTVRLVGPGVGHRSDAIKFGFPAGISALYQRWGLAP